MANAIENEFTIENLPAGFDFTKAKVEHEVAANRVHLVLPALLTWTQNLSEPELDDRDGSKKWSVAAAVPKDQAAKLITRIKTACDAMMLAEGVKGGTYPHFLLDGGEMSGGIYKKSAGKLRDFMYCTARTKRAPRLFVQGTDGVVPTEAEAIYSGGYGWIAGNVISVEYQGKKRTSFWFDKLLFAAGGKPIGSGGSRSEQDDFGGFVTGASSSSDDDLL
jgi:hypothetical protein